MSRSIDPAGRGNDGDWQAHPALITAIWANETDYGVRYNVTFQRLYKDGNDWKTPDSFGRDELPLVAKVADMAHTWICQECKSGNGNGNGGGAGN